MATLILQYQGGSVRCIEQSRPTAELKTYEGHNGTHGGIEFDEISIAGTREKYESVNDFFRCSQWEAGLVLVTLNGMVIWPLQDEEQSERRKNRY